jgi:hypothetical protein
MRIRSGSNQFTDTEIYALGYCGLQQRCVRFATHGLRQEAVGDREILQTQCANIMDGLLKPLPPDPMGKHLAFSDSRFCAPRALGSVLLEFSSDTVHSTVGQYVSRVGGVW